MEQYEIPPELYFENLQLALKHFKAEWIYTRTTGPWRGKVIISRKLNNKKLAITNYKNGLNIIIAGKKRFFYPTENTDKNNLWNRGQRWSVAYVRFYDDGRRHFLYPDEWEYFQKNGPLDLSLPKVKTTILRSANGEHLIEIGFPGKIPIKKVYLRHSPHENCYYWEIDV